MMSMFMPEESDAAITPTASADVEISAIAESPRNFAPASVRSREKRRDHDHRDRYGQRRKPRRHGKRHRAETDVRQTVSDHRTAF